MTFQLHPQLAADTIPVGQLGLCRVTLMNDSRFPWLILVPQRDGLRDIIDLERVDQITLLDEIDATSRALTGLYEPDKLNVAALGNMVPQLHVHVIARRIDDAAWPGPVWGVGTAIPYGESTRVQVVTDLANTLGVSD